jgi:hypothetical protein
VKGKKNKKEVWSWNTTTLKKDRKEKNIYIRKTGLSNADWTELAQYQIHW